MQHRFHISGVPHTISAPEYSVGRYLNECAKRTVHDYLELWTLYVAVLEQAGREASPTAAIGDSQSAKGAQKGGFGLILRATTRARVTYGGRFHPDSCRLIWKLTSGSAG